MSFNDIIGQDRVKKHLNNIIINNKIAHAYIFEGHEGIGKYTMAKAFSKALLCKNYNNNPCNTCSSCIKFNSMNHPDIKIIEPEGNSIKNEVVEKFQHDIHVKPYESEYKIYVIKKAHLMTVRAQNRLLKTLEEPPKYIIFIFITKDSSKILPTINSRCQILKFNKISKNDIIDFIINKYNVDNNKAKWIASFSDGSIGKVIKIVQSEEFNKKRESIIDIIEEILKNDSIKAFELFDYYKEYRNSIDEILDFMLFWFRDMMILKETNTFDFLINLDKKLIIKEHLDLIKYKNIDKIIKIINTTKNDIKANVNYQLAIEMMILKIQEV